MSLVDVFPPGQRGGGPFFYGVGLHHHPLLTATAPSLGQKQTNPEATRRLASAVLWSAVDFVSLGEISEFDGRM